MSTRSASFAVAPLFALALCRQIRGQESAPPPPVALAPNPAAAAATSSRLTPPQSTVDAEAQERARVAAAKWTIEVDVQMVALSQDLVLPLLSRLMSGKPDQVEGACKQIDVMIARKEATLIAWPQIVCLDGQRSVVESIVEQRYPTEWDPPVSDPGKSGLVADPAGEPTAFETRNVGTTLEAESSVLEDGGMILVNLVPQHVALRNFENFATAKSKDGPATEIKQPIFTTSKITTVVKVANGQRLLLTAHKHEGKPDQMQLMILHATATRLER